MKTKIILAITFLICELSISQISKHDSGIAYYKKTLIIENLEKSAIQDFFKTITDALDKVEFVLKFNSKESTFEIDEIVESSISNKATSMGGGRGLYYLNLNEDVRIHAKKAYGKLYLVKDILKMDSWKLTKEKKIINGYECHKALLKKDILSFKNVKEKKTIEAWYTVDLRYKYGPLGYGNLPGLIIELKEGNAIYTLDRINLQPYDKILQIDRPTKGELITGIGLDSISIKQQNIGKRDY